MGVGEFAPANVLIGGMRTGAITGANFEARERHQSLVAERGGAEVGEPKRQAAAHERMFQADVARLEAEGARQEHGLELGL